MARQRMAPGGEDLTRSLRPLALFLLSLVLLAWELWSGQPAGAADEPAKGSQASLNDLSMEVAALQTLSALKLTRPQLEQLRKMAEETAGKPQPRESAKGSEKFRMLLTSVRDALAKGDDDQRINDLQKQLDDLRASEKPELDDLVETTEEARGKAPEALKMLKASQVAWYVGGFADDIPDPRDRLLEALGKVRGMPPAEWKDFRDGISDDIGWMVSGLDPDEAAATGDKVVQLLIVARSLSDKEFKNQRPDLEKKALVIVGDKGPLEVLRNLLERNLAELLSNPQLPAAIDARLKSPVEQGSAPAGRGTEVPR